MHSTPLFAHGSVHVLGRSLCAVVPASRRSHGAPSISSARRAAPLPTTPPPRCCCPGRCCRPDRCCRRPDGHHQIADHQYRRSRLRRTRSSRRAAASCGAPTAPTRPGAWTRTRTALGPSSVPCHTHARAQREGVGVSCTASHESHPAGCVIAERCGGARAAGWVGAGSVSPVCSSEPARPSS